MEAIAVIARGCAFSVVAPSPGLHNSQMVPATYDQFEQVLRGARALPEPSEAHGTLAGALCSSRDYGLIEWLREILPDDSPDDESSLAERADALSSWCQGFLYGLGSGTTADPSGVSTEAAEIIRDLTEITHVGVDAGDETEENEVAFAAVVEFVRVGVQLLFVELAPARGEEPVPGATSIH
jgi:uncharacterized protein YgfB (UPF0149 family)